MNFNQLTELRRLAELAKKSKTKCKLCDGRECLPVDDTLNRFSPFYREVPCKCAIKISKAKADLAKKLENPAAILDLLDTLDRAVGVIKSIDMHRMSSYLSTDDMLRDHFKKCGEFLTSLDNNK